MTDANTPTKNKTRKALLLALILLITLLFLVPNAQAQWTEKLVNALGRGAVYAWQVVKGVVLKPLFWTINVTVDSIFEVLAEIFEPAVEVMFSTVSTLMVNNPTIYPLTDANPTVRALVRIVLSMLIPFYGILTMLVAIYIIYVAAVPEDRAMAKAQFNKLIMSMLLVSTAPVIFQVLLDIQREMTMTILDQFEANWSRELVRGVLAAFSSFYLYLPAVYVPLLGVVLLLFRFVMIWLLAIFFPLGFFLFFFDYTKTVGANILRTTILWIFMPVPQAIVLVVTASTAAEMTGHTLATGLVILAGMFAFVVAGLMVSGMLRWVGGVMAMVGSASGGTFGGALMMGAGQIMMGQGPNALVGAGAEIGYMRAGQYTPGVKGIYSKMKAGVKSYTGSGRGFEGGALSRFHQARMSSLGGFNRGLRQTLRSMNRKNAAAAPHPDQIKGGGGGGGGSGGGAGGGGGTGGGVFSAGAPSSGVTPETAVGAPPSGVTHFSPSSDRYGKRSSEAGSWQTTSGGKTARITELPQVWWDEKLGSFVEGANWEDARKAADAGTPGKLRGLSLMAYGYEQLRTPGSSKIGAVGSIVRGAAGVGYSLLPMSPFVPVREIGGLVVGVSSIVLPPGLRGVGYYVGTKMMGLGVRQVWGRTHGSISFRHSMHKIKRLDKKIAATDAKISAATTQGEADALKTQRDALKRDKEKQWNRAKSWLESARDGSPILGEKDQNMYEQMLSELENDYQVKGEMPGDLTEDRNYYRRFMRESVMAEGVFGIDQKVSSDLAKKAGEKQAQGMDKRAAWREAVREQLDKEAEYVQEVEDKNANGEYASKDEYKAALSAAKKRQKLTNYFKYTRTGYRQKTTVPMTSKKDGFEDAKDSAKLDALLEAVPDDDDRLDEQADVAERTFGSGVNSFVRLNARERAAVEHMEYQDGTAVIDVERTDHGDVFLSQNDFKYLRSMMAWEGGPATAGKIGVIERGGRPVTDSEGNYLVRNYARSPKHSSLDATDRHEYDRLTAEAEALHQQGRHAEAVQRSAQASSIAKRSSIDFLHEKSEDPYYASINAQGGRNATITYTGYDGRAYYYDADSVVTRGGVQGFEGRDIVKARADYSESNAKALEKAAKRFERDAAEFDRQHMTAEADEARRNAGAHRAFAEHEKQTAERIRAGKDFVALEDMVGDGAASFTPSSGRVVHVRDFEKAQDIETDMQGHVFISGAGFATEEYIRKDFRDAEEMNEEIEKRRQELDEMTSKGVYINMKQSEAAIQQCGLTGRQINDLTEAIADENLKLPEHARVGAVTFSYDSEDRKNTLATERVTRTLIVNLGSDRVRNFARTGRGNITAGLGHEAAHNMTTAELSAGGAKRQVDTQKKVYRGLYDEGGRRGKPYKKDLGDETYISGLAEAVEASGDDIRKAAYSEADKGMAVDETISWKIGLEMMERYDRQTQEAEQRLMQAHQAGDEDGMRGAMRDIVRSQRAKIDFLGFFSDTAHDVVEDYGARAGKKANTLTDDANMCQFKVAAEEISERSPQIISDVTATLDSVLQNNDYRNAMDNDLRREYAETTGDAGTVGGELENLISDHRTGRTGSIDQALSESEVVKKRVDQKRFNRLQDGLRAIWTSGENENRQIKLKNT